MTLCTAFVSTLAQLEGEMSKKDERIAELHHALTMLDQEHDALRSEVDAKAELLDQLDQQVKAKDGHIEEQEQQMRELENELSMRRGESDMKGEELQGLRQQVELAAREAEQLKSQLTKAGQHEEELRQDLGTMTQVHLLGGFSSLYSVLESCKNIFVGPYHMPVKIRRMTFFFTIYG